MECVRDTGMPVQGSRQTGETWTVLPALLHGGWEKLDDVHQESGSTGGAQPPQALSTVQNAEQRTGACTHRLNPQNRIPKEDFMTYMDELLAIFQKKGA